jgi:hypothetical protein
MACTFCGRALRSPATVEEEMAMVRDQAAAAARLATAEGNKLLGTLTMGGSTRIENLQNLAQFWSTAFVPTTVPAIVSALNLCAAGVPAATAWDADHVRPLVVALSARADALDAALSAHPEATDRDRALGQRVRSMLADRLTATRAAGKRMWKGIGIAYAALFIGVPLIIFLLFRIHDCGKTPTMLAEERCRSSWGEEKLTGCIEACSGGIRWACDMAASLKEHPQRNAKPDE